MKVFSIFGNNLIKEIFIMLYKDWLSRWLLICVKPKVKEKTYQRYCSIAGLQLNPNLGEYEMNELTLILLQNCIAELSEHYAANTVKLAIYIMKTSIEFAQKSGVVEGLLLQEIASPKVREKKVECFTIIEQKTIENYVFNSRKLKLFGIVLCMYSGLRIGELFALKWSDFDLKQGYLEVNKTCFDHWEYGKYKKTVYEPKTENAYRLVPIPKQLIGYLTRVKKSSENEYIMSDEFGQDISIRSYQRTFELLLKKLNIPHRGFHSLRHTFATRALECGMDVKTLSELLGHSDPTITLRRYAHSLSEHKINMINRLGKLLQAQ